MDAEEFEALYRSTVRDVLTYVRRRAPRDSEDLVAEAFAIAWRRRASMPDSGLRRAWLFGIARNLVLASHRGPRPSAALDEASAQVGRSTGGGDPGVEDIVATAMARLPLADQEILRLASWEGLTPAEVAVVLGVRPGTARVRLHRARQALARDPQVQALVAARTRACSTDVG